VALFGTAEGHERVHRFAGIAIGDVDRILLESVLELNREPFAAYGRAIADRSGDYLAHFSGLLCVLPRARGAFFGNLLQVRFRRHALHGCNEIGRGEPHIGDQSEIDGINAREARRILPD
jgi:hypothetical protein